MAKSDKTKLLAKIESFLTTRSLSDGGWAPVSKEDFDSLDEIFSELIDAKWGADPDGDRPINFKLIDRTRFEPDHFDLYPYIPLMGSKRYELGPKKLRQTMLDYIETAAGNVEEASNRLRTATKLLRMDRQDEETQEIQDRQRGK